MLKAFMVNDKAGTSYEVLGMITKEGKPFVRLKGKYVDTPFDEPYTKDRMVKLGYRMERREVADA